MMHIAGLLQGYLYSCSRFGFIGNQPFLTRLRWSKSSFMVQNEENANTPAKEDNIRCSVRMEQIIPMMPIKRKNHQQRVPHLYSAFITIG